MGRLYATQMRRREETSLIANHAIESDESRRLIEEAERLISQAIVDQGELLVERAKRDQELLRREIADGYIQMMSVQIA
jgi:PP-loop superfamily ATP-utilizing enzyme